MALETLWPVGIIYSAREAWATFVNPAIKRVAGASGPVILNMQQHGQNHSNDFSNRPVVLTV